MPSLKDKAKKKKIGLSSTNNFYGEMRFKKDNGGQLV